MTRAARESYLLTAAGLVMWSTTASATPDPSEVAYFNIEARGGADNIRAISSYRMHGTISSEYGSAPFCAIWKRPGKLRIEIRADSMNLVMATDGTWFWKLEPGPWDPEAQAMVPYERDVFARQADFETPLLDAYEGMPGLKVGWPSTADTSEGYALEWIDADSTKTAYWINRVSRLITWQTYRAGNGGLSFDVDVRFSDYRPVAGVQFAHGIERLVEGNPYDLTVVDSVIVGQRFDDSLFCMPPAQRIGDTGTVLNLESVLPLRDTFRADSGSVRIIALLSPT